MAGNLPKDPRDRREIVVPLPPPVSRDVFATWEERHAPPALREADLHDRRDPRDIVSYLDITPDEQPALPPRDAPPLPNETDPRDHRSASRFNPPAVREPDARDKRVAEDIKLYPAERLPDPLDHPVYFRVEVPADRPPDLRDQRDPPRTGFAPNIREPDPLDHRDTRNLALEDAWMLPSPALKGQVITSTFGHVYQFDGEQWVPGASATITADYIFDVGLIEAPPGTVNLEPATPTVIGGITEPATDGLFLRSAALGVYSWTPAPPGTAYVWGIGIDEDLLVPGTINVIPATDIEIGGILEPPPDGALYARVRDTLGVSTWQPAAAGIVTDLEPPVPPMADQLWWDTDAGKLYVYYTDSPSGAAVWVQVA